MSDEENQGEGNKKKKNKAVPILIAVNVLTLGGFGAFVLLGSNQPAEAASTEQVADSEKAGDAKKGDAKKGDAKKGEEKKGAKDAKDEPTEDEVTRAEAEAAKAASKGGGEIGPTAIIGKFTINLADRSTARYLRAVVKVELDSEDTAAEIKRRNPQLRHIAIAYLSSLRRKDTQGPGALDEIRSALERRFNHVLTSGAVKQVYFTDFVTQ